MNTYEREYFVSRIRSGLYYLNVDSLKIKILTPTIEDEFLSNEVFFETFDQARSDDILTEEGMYDWMISKDLWSKEKDQKIEGCKKDIEKLKVEIFQNRNKEKFRETIRLYLRAAEKGLSKLHAEKEDLFSRTCEGIATQEKTMFLFGKCCFIGNQPIDIKDFDLTSLYYEYNKLQLNEKDIRELARNDPWRLCWYCKDHSPLFANEKNRTLSNDQKGILIWANMYDNIHESMDCPTEDVIEDDDMLDGWFIIQRRKQQNQKAQSEMETKTQNQKIANSDEIIIMADSTKEAEKIYGMNSFGQEMVIKQRMDTIKKLGTASDTDFQDIKIDMQNKQMTMFKDRVRR
jgi:hypothetical protein